MRDMRFLFVLLLVVAGGAALYFVLRDEPLGEGGGLIGDATEAAPLSGSNPDVRRPNRADPATLTETQKPPTPKIEEKVDRITAKDEFGLYVSGLQGVVIDPSGRPVAEAEVALCEDASPNPAFTVALAGKERATVRTSEDGKFEFEGLATYESFVVRARHPDFAPVIVSPIKLVSASRIPLVLQLSSGVKIEGTVRDESNRPIAGATVNVRNAREASIDTLHSIVATVATDAAGKFLMEHVPAGPKTFDASSPGYARAVVADVDVGGADRRAVDFVLKTGGTIRGTVVDPDKNPIAGAEIAANPIVMDMNGIKLRTMASSDARGAFELVGLEPGSFVITASIPGTSFVGRANAVPGATDLLITIQIGTVVKGVVVDDDTGAPVKAFTLVSSPTPQLLARPKERSRVVIDPTGKFEFPLSYVTPQMREAYLFALAPGYAGGSVQLQLMPPDGPPRPHEKTIDGLVIRMRRGGHVTGKVTDTSGIPISDARISLIIAPDASKDGMENRLAAFLDLSRGQSSAVCLGVTDKDGKFDVAGELPGRYFLRIEHSEFAALQTRDAIEVPQRGEASAGTLQLFRGGRVMGTVFDKQKQPEEGSRVTLTVTELGAGEYRSMVTGIAGEFDFNHVAPGVYLLSVVERRGVATALTNLLSGAGSSSSGVTITVADGETVVQNF